MADVLIVDDEEMDRLVVRSTLEDLGHGLLFAPDGEAPCHGLTDCAWSRRSWPSIPTRIIAVTGVSPEMLATAEDFGATFTMHKPIDPQELARAVDKAAAIPTDKPWW